jgi:hypothetical protein
MKAQGAVLGVVPLVEGRVVCVWAGLDGDGEVSGAVHGWFWFSCFSPTIFALRWYE